ncbi:LysR family transcriptional regulator [Bacillus sp. Marseille-P3661]|uniref:LysR family transcriptional regulator n=1 Tax=Bacillus sp. Marseille-P3661 TaxID=1936234 RepID=UPI000C83F411|nr:LysR family transcriptional regulator [Bacillus sp. Marseille-P3661]
MELRLLEYFMAVCKELHFTKAAEKLGISQPTLSQQIKLLEDRLETQLFKRVGRKILITEAGKILLKHSEQIFQELKQAELEIKELKGFQRGKLTIGCSGNLLLHSSILSFHKQYPKISLSVIDTTTTETVKQVVNGNFDLGVIFLPTEEPQLETKKLFSSEMKVVIAEDHKFAKKTSIKLIEIIEEPIFLLQKNYWLRKEVDNFCKKQGIPLTPVVESSDTFSLIEMTVQNKGICILPHSYIINMKNDKIKTLTILDELPKQELGLIYRKNEKLSPIANAFMEHLIDNYNE